MRFIPACAGNARADLRGGIDPAVHPRVCGERRFALLAKSLANGSSPRVRGTRSTASPRFTVIRFIPACAGNAGVGRSATGRWAVHPRVCGERSRNSAMESSQSGSSPRVRGTLLIGEEMLPTKRFIPACAGNAHCRRKYPSTVPVHPRVCGEREAAIAVMKAWGGSSPRVRGTPLRIGRACGPLRFIPACAGNA